MRIEHATLYKGKGWYLGPWNSSLPISIGYADVGVDEPHLHTHITEIYVVARGTSRLRLGHETINLSAGDLVVVEPGEAHTFLDSSPDYFHIVIHTPGLSGDDAGAEKSLISPEQLGL